MDTSSMVSDFGKMNVRDQKNHPLDHPPADTTDTTTSNTASSNTSFTESIDRDVAPGAGASTTSKSKSVSAYKQPGIAANSVESHSPGADMSDSESGSPTKPTSSPLKATAAEFKPSPHQPQSGAFDSFTSSHNPSSPPKLFEIGPSGRGGTGVFAAQNIPLGTRIICDSPLLTIPSNQLYLVWGPYCRLGNAEKRQFDALYFWENTDLHLEQASRMCLLDYTDDAIESDDEEELIAEHVRVMGIFAVNNFEMPKGALGLFPNGARLNHSCVPNVHHSYNPTLNKLTVHAVRDIFQGEELVMNYMGQHSHFWTHTKRWEYLRSRYGFTCQCEACSDTTGTNDSRREMLQALVWGLEEFHKGQPDEGHFLIPSTGPDALAQAEQVITLLIQQGLFAMELTRAYRLASSLALDLGYHQKALEYASNEAEVEKNIFGTELDDLKKHGTASEVWIKNMFVILKDKQYTPYTRLAEKIYNITGVKHEVLADSSDHKSSGRGKKGGKNSKRTSPKKISPKKKEPRPQEEEKDAV
ncbi:hypothetical protein PRZ48_013949 [Zasmidium cellare]|uniref:SET domain-containing protein n=1 Tax=Zasmidium cellare TaxID=395010 RepID=A0ABR0E0A5_ZASCE|nr:hypothetical protein PRZ48_013949 [Zasmidium cellare]